MAPECTIDEDGSKRWAWSAWTIWRGDVKLAAHIAQVALAEVERNHTPARLRIQVVVRGDLEEFGSVKKFVNRLSPQAARGFTRLTIRAESPQSGAEVQIARKKVPDFPFNGYRGLVIQTWASSGGDEEARTRVAREMCDRLRVAVRRGSMPRTRGLQETETTPRDQIKQRLQWLAGRRNWATWTIVMALASLPLYLLLGLSAIADVDEGSTQEILPYLALAQVPVAIAAFGLARFVMPPIELAEITPGRRMLGLIGKSGVVSVVTGLGAALLKSTLNM